MLGNRFNSSNKTKNSYTPVFFLLLMLTSACDVLNVGSGESIFLQTSRVVCFEFTGLTDGGSKSITSDDSFDLASFLQSEGFTKSEIIRAEIEGVTLRLRFPGQENLSVFDEATVTLRSGSASVSVGSANNLGASRNASISTTGSNISAIVRAASFNGVLDVVGAADIQDEFLVEIELDFSLEMEGV